MDGCNDYKWWLGNPCTNLLLVQHLGSSKGQGASLKFLLFNFFLLSNFFQFKSYTCLIPFIYSSKVLRILLSFISSCSIFICHASFIYFPCLLFSFFNKFLFLLKSHLHVSRSLQSVLPLARMITCSTHSNPLYWHGDTWIRYPLHSSQLHFYISWVFF